MPLERRPRARGDGEGEYFPGALGFTRFQVTQAVINAHRPPVELVLVVALVELQQEFFLARAFPERFGVAEWYRRFAVNFGGVVQLCHFWLTRSMKGS